MRGMLANTGDLLAALKFTTEETAAVSQEVLTLANALSEAKGGSIAAAEATEILNKGLLGERDSLVGLNIKVLDADVKARTAAKGQDKLTGAAKRQAEAMATLELITEQSANALKTYEEGGDPALRASKKLEAQWAQMQETAAELALALTPLVELLTVVASVVGEVGDTSEVVEERFQSLKDSILETDSSLVDLGSRFLETDDVLAAAEERNRNLREAFDAVTIAAAAVGSDRENLNRLAELAGSADQKFRNLKAAIEGAATAQLEAASPLLTLIRAQGGLEEAQRKHADVLDDITASEQDRRDAALELIEAAEKEKVARDLFTDTAPEAVRSFEEIALSAGLYVFELEKIYGWLTLIAEAPGIGGGPDAPRWPTRPRHAGTSAGPEIWDRTQLTIEVPVTVELDGRVIAQTQVDYLADELARRDRSLG